MRPMLRLLGTRYGLALLLVLVVVGVVGVARATGAGRPADTSGYVQSPTDSVAGAAPTVSDPGDDGAIASAQPAPSTGPTSRRPGSPAAETVAKKFTQDWLAHTRVDGATWLARLRPSMTRALADKLAGVDPAGVPATRITGGITMTNHDPTFVEATIPVDSGTVQLRLLLVDGLWLVDGIDWSRE
jgi:hypothetical protein